MPSIGKYEILEQLGSGSMGTVHRGRDTLLDRMVALKMIRTGVNIELEAKERFYREARTCARLSHPHIVSVYDLGEENGTSFIAMELLKGADFRQLIERKEPIPLPVKLIAMAQICEGLAHAHREGVIHRDIKPSNLFLLADGRAKIVDFGIAKLPTSHLTRSGAVLGTPNYMAPEQIQGLNCDGRADLFSAGMVFFEFLTYRHPFNGNMIPQRILDDKPDSLFQHDPTLPRILDQIFARALAKKPDQRYATGDEFAADLRAVVDGIALNASPTFSSVELPSASSFEVPPRIPQSDTAQAQSAANIVNPGSSPSNAGTGNNNTSSGIGTGAGADWRASRMQQLLPSLDQQIAHRDLVGARSSLAELQSVAGLDPRFRAALDHYRACVSELEGAGSRTSSTGFQTATGAACPKCGVSNRAGTAFCISCGAGLVATTVPPPPSNPVLPNIGAVPVTPIRPPAPAGPKSAGWTSDKRRLALVAGLIVVVAIALLILPTFFRQTKEEPYIASARVAAQQAALRSDPADAAKTITSVQRGTVVHVLALPKSLSSGWVKIQARDGDGYTRPGYVQTPELIEWESKDAKVALALARMSGPMEAGTDAEIRNQIDHLTSVAATFSGKPEANAAALDAARLEFVLDRRLKDSNPMGDWPARLTDLASRVEPLRSDSQVQSGAEDLLKQIRELLATAPQGSTPPVAVPGATPPSSGGPPPVAQPTLPEVPVTEEEVKATLALAEKLRKSYQYNSAKVFVNRVLKANPTNVQAQELLKKINAAIELERSAQ